MYSTCTKEGKQVRSCTTKNCGSHQYRTIAKIPHDYAPATCTKPQTCTVCKATTGSALGHDYKVPATCEHGVLCSRCGAEQPGTKTKSHEFPDEITVACGQAVVCKTCGNPNGKIGTKHTPKPSTTCREKSPCMRCGTEVSGAHNWVTQGTVTKCTYCGMARVADNASNKATE